MDCVALLSGIQIAGTFSFGVAAIALVVIAIVEKWLRSKEFDYEGDKIGATLIVPAALSFLCIVIMLSNFDNMISPVNSLPDYCFSQFIEQRKAENPAPIVAAPIQNNGECGE